MSDGSPVRTLERKKPCLPLESTVLHVRKGCGKVAPMWIPRWRVFSDYEVVHNGYTRPGQRKTEVRCGAERCGEKKTAAAAGKWTLAAPSRQCACPFLTNCEGLLGTTSHLLEVCRSLYTPDLAPCGVWHFTGSKLIVQTDDIWNCVRRKMRRGNFHVQHVPLGPELAEI